MDQNWAQYLEVLIFFSVLKGISCNYTQCVMVQRENIKVLKLLSCNFTHFAMVYDVFLCYLSGSIITKSMGASCHDIYFDLGDSQCSKLHNRSIFFSTYFLQWRQRFEMNIGGNTGSGYMFDCCDINSSQMQDYQVLFLVANH